MCAHTFTLDDKLVEKISSQFTSRESMWLWLQRELELLVIHHADGFAKADVRIELSRLSQRIASLRQLKAGWDGQAALAPSPKALQQVAMVVSSMPEDILSSCAIFPSNDSCVYLQGRFPNGRLAAYFNGETMTYILKSPQEQMEKKNVAVENESVKQLAQSIKQYCMA
jgi:hypothetical protein